MVYTDITVQEILEIRHSQFEILTDNLTLVMKHISLFKLLMLDGREFHRFVPEFRKGHLKYSLFGVELANYLMLQILSHKDNFH